MKFNVLIETLITYINAMQLLTDIICVNNSEMKRNYFSWCQLVDRPFVCRLITCWVISTKINTTHIRIKQIYYFLGNGNSLIVILETMYTFFFKLEDNITVLLKVFGLQNMLLPNLSLYAYMYLGKGIPPFPKCLSWQTCNLIWIILKCLISNCYELYKWTLNMHFYHGKRIFGTPAIFHNGICNRYPWSHPLLI